MGLLDRAGDLVSNPPCGHQRKVEIARALAADPALLLLDEPAAGLNTMEKRQLVELLHRLRDLGLTILVIERDMPLLELSRGQPGQSCGVVRRWVSPLIRSADCGPETRPSWTRPRRGK